MGNEKIKNIIKRSVAATLLVGAFTSIVSTTTIVNAENNAVFKTVLVSNTEETKEDKQSESIDFDNDGGVLLSKEELSSPSLVNPHRDYFYRYHGEYQGKKSVVSVQNVEDKFDYVVMEPLSNNYSMPDLSHLKYIAVHETGMFGEGVWAMNNFSHFTKSVENATFIVDDNTVVKAMELTEVSYALGDTDPAKSDVYNTNSLNIEMCVNADGNYLKTVGNTVYLVRGLLEKIPGAELKQHADSWSEGRNQYHADSAQKNCPEILRSESTWWTWERFVYFSKHKELPIPFLDFNPMVEAEVPDELKEYLGFTVKAEDKKEEVSKVDSISDLNKYITSSSLFVNNNLNDDERLAFDRYIEIDAEAIFNKIKDNSKAIKLSDEELKSLITSVNLACKMEKVNPLIVIELINSYTGYLSYGGNVQKEDNNFGGLKDKKGEYIKYSNINEGAIAFTQYIKTLTSKSKLKLKSENKDALKLVKKGSVNSIADLAEALNVPQNFVNSVANRVLSY